MSAKIYVGGIPYTTTNAELNDLFALHGTVESARVIMDRVTGHSRGFGFVEMASAEEAQHAIAALHGSEYGGKTLTVNEAWPMRSRAGSSENHRTAHKAARASQA